MNVEQVRQMVVDGRLMSAAAIDGQIADWQVHEGSPDDGDAFIERLVERQFINELHGLAMRAGVSGPYEIGPYRVFDRITAGRLGNVFRGVHADFNQPVSLKVFPAALSQDPERSARLSREARVAIQVNDPHVVRTFQVGKVGPVTFMAFEDLQGETLAARLERDKKLPIFEACHLAREVALGLAHLHSLDIVHRNIEPANIWVTADTHAKLMEFGAARDALSFLDAQEGGESPFTMQSKELLGHTDYMAPEQGANEHNADGRSDIYSLGCVLFHMLTGEVVFPDSNPVRKMLKKACETPRLASDVNPDIPEPIAEIVATMLSKDPKDRYQQAEDAAWALEQHLKLEEWQVAVAGEINSDFLEWAHSTKELETPVAVADAGLIGFLDWMAEHEEDEAEELGLPKLPKFTSDDALGDSSAPLFE